MASLRNAYSGGLWAAARLAEVHEVIVVDFDSTRMTCLAYLTGELALRAQVDQEPERYGDDEWDRGYFHTQRIDIAAGLSATLAEGGAVQLQGASLDEERIVVPWRNVEGEIG